jgi:hypothetical protein
MNKDDVQLIFMKHKYYVTIERRSVLRLS